MDWLLLCVGVLLMILGIIGSVVPVIPGPILSYIGILTLHFTSKGDFSLGFLIFWLVLTILVSVLDNIIPVLSAKKYKASKGGIYGSIIGLIIGMFFFSAPRYYSWGLYWGSSWRIYCRQFAKKIL